MIVISDYCGFRIEIEAVAADGRWNADVRMRRLFSQEKPRVERVTCFKANAGSSRARGANSEPSGGLT